MIKRFPLSLALSPSSSISLLLSSLSLLPSSSFSPSSFPVTSISSSPHFHFHSQWTPTSLSSPIASHSNSLSHFVFLSPSLSPSSPHVFFSSKSSSSSSSPYPSPSFSTSLIQNIMLNPVSLRRISALYIISSSRLPYDSSHKPQFTNVSLENFRQFRLPILTYHNPMVEIKMVQMYQTPCKPMVIAMGNESEGKHKKELDDLILLLSENRINFKNQKDQKTKVKVKLEVGGDTKKQQTNTPPPSSPLWDKDSARASEESMVLFIHNMVKESSSSSSSSPSFSSPHVIECINLSPNAIWTEILQFDRKGNFVPTTNQQIREKEQEKEREKERERERERETEKGKERELEQN